MKKTKYIVGLVTMLTAPWANAQLNIGPNNLTNANGTYSSITAGDFNKITSLSGYSIIGGGWRNTNAAQFVTIGGGYRSYAGADYSTIPGGHGARTRSQGQLAYSSGTFSGAQGEAQFGLYVLRGTVSGAATNLLSLDGNGTQHITVATNGSFLFDIDVACRSTSSSNSVVGPVMGNFFHCRMAVENQNGDLVCQPVDSSSVTNHNPSLIALYSCDHDKFQLSGTGEVGNTVYWVATVRATELVKP